MDLKDLKNEILSCGIPVDRLFPPVAEGSSLIVAVSPGDYLASTIARAVEDTDAHLLNLNVSDDRTEDDELMVHLRIDRRHALAAARSLERYGYRVVAVDSGNSTQDESVDDDTTRERVNALLRYLEI